MASGDLSDKEIDKLLLAMFGDMDADTMMRRREKYRSDLAEYDALYQSSLGHYKETYQRWVESLQQRD